LSSAILYLAIVAIWACVLVPRWLHRSHEATSEPEAGADLEEAGDLAEASDDNGLGPLAEPGTDAAAHADPAPAGSAAQAGPAGYADSGAYVGSAAYSSPAARSGFAAPADSGARPDVGWRDPYAPARRPGPAAGRARILQARRRMLTMLVTLAIAATGCALVGLTRWWTAVPPVGMLGAYLMLLREAAHADGDLIRRAEAQARAWAARAAHERTQEARERAREAPPLQPTAEVIDISGRTAQVVDQLYDQYADATVRAVGD
jgi:hypothetical protein